MVWVFVSCCQGYSSGNSLNTLPCVCSRQLLASVVVNKLDDVSTTLFIRIVVGFLLYIIVVCKKSSLTCDKKIFENSFEESVQSIFSVKYLFHYGNLV